MATAVTKLAEVVSEVVVGYTLTLTEEEASALLLVAANVGGSPEKARGLINSISIALQHAGATRLQAAVRGSIYFED